MDFPIRAVPAAETEIIAKTVIHPNIFAFTSTHTSNFGMFFLP